MDILIINSLTHMHLIPHNEIVYCKSDNCYSTIFLNSGQELVACKSLIKLSKELTPQLFIRVSQSYMINKTYIYQIDKKAKFIELRNKVKLPFNIAVRDLLKMIQNR